MSFAKRFAAFSTAREVAQPGDYKTTYMGLVPVILTRDEDGGLHVLVNRCMHRAATVCQRESGNASYFRCEYHAWTYDNTGRLIGISRPKGYAREELDEFPGGLSSAARVASYRGLIFASFAREGPGLDEHLGLTKAYIDEWADQSPTGSVRVDGGVWKHRYRGNWKLQVEGSNEGYHPEFLHRINAVMREKAGGRGLSWSETDAVGIDLGSGHSLMEFPASGSPHPPEYVAVLNERLGAERAKRVARGACSSFRISRSPRPIFG